MRNDGMSGRERELLPYLALPAKAVARRLFLSTGTVKNRLNGIYRKLGIAGRGAGKRNKALVRALAWGLVDLSDLEDGDGRPAAQ